MAATPLIFGVMREVWSETASQPGGAPQTFITGIRINAGELSRVKGLLTITGFTGSPTVSVTAGISVGGFLTITVANPAADSTINWLLDVQLTHTVQQAPSADAAVILIASGVLAGGPGGTETLAQAYNLGTTAADQTLTLDTAKGGGLVIDATTGTVTGPLSSLEVKQSAAVLTPVVLDRRGADAFGPVLEFNTGRGTFGAPTDVLVNDVIGAINYKGIMGGVLTPAGHVNVVCTDVSAGPQFSTAFDFAPSSFSVDTPAFRMQADSAGGHLTGFGTSPSIMPQTTQTGSLGIGGLSPQRWNELHVHTAYVIDNVCLGGVATGFGANQTVVLPVTATPPGASVGLTHLFSQNAFVLGAALAIFQEAPTAVYSAEPPTTLVPVVVNGVAMYLFAHVPGPS